MKETENIKYNQSINNLSAWLYQNELERRKWANEAWWHPNGRLFKLCRILTYALSVYTLITVIIYCLIRDTQRMMAKLVGDMMDIQYDADTKYVTLYITIMAIMCAAILIGNVLLFFKKYKASSIVIIPSTVVVLIHIITQLGIPMGNIDKYRIFFSVNSFIYALLIACAFVIMLILEHDKREMKRMLDNTLSKITQEKKQLLSLDDYSMLIDEYLEIQYAKSEKSKSRGKLKT